MALKDEMVRFGVNIDLDEKEIAKFTEKMKEAENSCTNLRKEIKLDKQALAILEAQGIKTGDSYDNLTKRIKDNETQLKQSSQSAKQYSKVLNITDMSANQLKARMKELRNTINSMHKSADPVKWKELNKELKATEKRFNEVKVGGSNVSQTLLKQFGSLKNIGLTAAITTGYKVLKKIGKDALTQTQTWSDRWAVFTSGMTAAYNQFVASISTGDWSHLLKNMADAYEAGRKVAEILDELFERNNSLSITESINEAAIAKLKIDLRNVNLSDEKRIAAGEKILKLEDEIRKSKKEIADQELEAALLTLGTRTKMSQTEREFLIDRYNANKDIIRQGTEIIAMEGNVAKLRRQQYKDMDGIIAA